MGRNVRDGKIRACMPLPPSSDPSLIQRERRRGFCLLDRLMRQESRSKGSGQREVTVGSAFLLTLSRYTNLINWTRERVVCLFRCAGRAHACRFLACFYIHLCLPSVWRSNREGDFWPEITQVSLMKLDWFKVAHLCQACIQTCALHRWCMQNPGNMNKTLVHFKETAIRTKLPNMLPTS